MCARCRRKVVSIEFNDGAKNKQFHHTQRERERERVNTEHKCIKERNCLMKIHSTLKWLQMNESTRPSALTVLANLVCLHEM